MLAIVFLSNTCQNTPVESENRVVTISVDTDDATVIPAVDKKSSYTEYGPGQTAQSTIKRDDKVTSNVGVIIGPSSGLNTDVMDYLSCVIKSDIKINFVTGLGNSSLVAALFSQTRKPELVKWKFFRLKEKEDISSIISELEINARSIKRSNTALYLSSMSQSKKLTLETKGNILKNLSYNFLNSGDIQKLASDVVQVDTSRLVADKVLVFSYGKKLDISKNENDGKIINIVIPTENYSLMKKCEVIKENL